VRARPFTRSRFVFLRYLQAGEAGQCKRRDTDV